MQDHSTIRVLVTARGVQPWALRALPAALPPDLPPAARPEPALTAAPARAPAPEPAPAPARPPTPDAVAPHPSRSAGAANAGAAPADTPPPCHARARQRVDRVLARLTCRHTLAPLLSSSIKLGLATWAQGHSEALRDGVGLAAATSALQAATSALMPRSPSVSAADRRRQQELSLWLSALEAPEPWRSSPAARRVSRPALQSLQARLERLQRTQENLGAAWAGLLAAGVLMHDAVVASIASQEAGSGRLSPRNELAVLLLMAASLALDLATSAWQLRSRTDGTDATRALAKPAPAPTEGPDETTPTASAAADSHLGSRRASRTPPSGSSLLLEEDFLVPGSDEECSTPEVAFSQRTHPQVDAAGTGETDEDGSGRCTLGRAESRLDPALEERDLKHGGTKRN